MWENEKGRRGGEGRGGGCAFSRICNPGYILISTFNTGTLIHVSCFQVSPIIERGVLNFGGFRGTQ